MADPTLTIALSVLAGLLVIIAALLHAWRSWLAYKRSELDHGAPRRDPDRVAPEGAARIEIADLKERIRKLEAIASGVDL
ncbi:hypothetical protein MKP08_05840 [Erythrobacter sp. LQ02-29]|uniref:hypothetical protein n=1 Tax=unclassified Erythrobacter TaxID=2633097 RepID=UPI001BFC9E70|nr:MULTISPECIES: hypothetical protein [unclassified Erythrobacter]MCP9222266.1 hypothetical protein [Erythrobacter sp. LQ02-29]QWC56427.1 hypothetical protein F7D01_04370 [Erythrobacter sp. 3-20A1M]